MEEQTIMQQTDDRNAEIDRKLRQFFDGRIVRKDLTKKIKEGANVPVYVLEFLLGQYCSSDDPEVVYEGVADRQAHSSGQLRSPGRGAEDTFHAARSAAAIRSSTR